MAFRLDQLEAPLGRLDQLLGGMTVSAPMKIAVDRWRSDAAALRFHLHRDAKHKPLVLSVIGGTGTGKSTLVNRLLGADASATSFRRTFTSGAVAVARDAGDVPKGWLGVDHAIVAAGDKLPVRGQIGSLAVIPRVMLGQKPPEGESDLLSQAVLVDTPDLDGDQPVHHAEADRAFRWSQAVIFLVTPEKYQMTELMPYYRLASRYATPTLFVMNKCEEQVVIEDYRTQLAAMGFGKPPAGDNGAPPEAPPEKWPPVYTVARDDAGFEPAADENLAALRGAIGDIRVPPAQREAGLHHRGGDLVGRFEDQIVAPLRQERAEADRLVAALRDMETPAPGVDVNPVTQDLQRRLQQRSVLYLMGPQRVLDRVRQAPAMLVRLPRVAWDYLMRGDISAAALNPTDPNKPREVPDFRVVLEDQFSVLQSRIDDLLRDSAVAQRWIAGRDMEYGQAWVAPQSAARIAEEELAELRSWLEKRWNATPRDTKVLQSLLRYLPGGARLTAIAEAAPYLLTIGLIAHHAVFGTDLLILGGYTLATWLSERLSNEVAAHTRAANVRIADRFTRLAHEQIQKMCAWINHQAAPLRTVQQLEKAAGELARAVGAEE